MSQQSTLYKVLSSLPPRQNTRTQRRNLNALTIILKGSAEGSAKPYQHHEESYFVKQKGHWKYVNEVCKLDSK